MTADQARPAAGRQLATGAVLALGLAAVLVPAIAWDAGWFASGADEWGGFGAMLEFRTIIGTGAGALAGVIGRSGRGWTEFIAMAAAAALLEQFVYVSGAELETKVDVAVLLFLVTAVPATIGYTAVHLLRRAAMAAFR